MVKISGYKYQKSILLIAAVILSFYFFHLSTIRSFFSDLDQIGYLVAVISGMIFSFGFTVPFAISSFILLNPSNIALATILGLAGCIISNLFIYHFFNDQFMSEFDISRRNPLLRRFDVEMKKGIFDKLKIYLSCTFVGILMCLPISEETETLVFTGFKELKTSNFVLIGILINLILIFLFLLI